MSDLGWRADGIARAKAAGGIELETYRRPGFAGGIGVKRSKVEVDVDYRLADYEPDPYPPEADE